MQPPEQPQILEDLQSGDPARESVALRTLMSALLQHAANELGARRRFVNSQAESVVQHAVAKELAEGAIAYRRFANDQHLYGRMHLAVSHRIQEVLRSRKENHRHLEQSSVREPLDEPRFDPPAHGEGPRTEIGRRDARASFEERNAASRARLLGATPAADHELVRLAVFEGRRSDAIAAELGTSSDNVRMKMSRLRRRLRECLLAPVLAELGADDRAVVEALFIERVEVEVIKGAASGARGDAAAILAHRVTEIVRTPLVESLGDEGVVYLMRLLGKPKAG